MRGWKDKESGLQLNLRKTHKKEVLIWNTKNYRKKILAVKPAWYHLNRLKYSIYIKSIQFWRDKMDAFNYSGKKALYCENCRKNVMPEHKKENFWIDRPLIIEDSDGRIRKCPNCGGRLRSKGERIWLYIRLSIIALFIIVFIIVIVFLFFFRPNPDAII